MAWSGDVKELVSARGRGAAGFVACAGPSHELSDVENGLWKLKRAPVLQRGADPQDPLRSAKGLEYHLELDQHLHPEALPLTAQVLPSLFTSSTTKCSASPRRLRSECQFPDGASPSAGIATDGW